MLKWYGHSCFKVRFDKRSYFLDPIRRNIMLETTLYPDGENEVCAIFISHDHWEHFDWETVLKLSSASTNIYCPVVVAISLYHKMSFEAKKIEEFKEQKKRVFPLEMGEIIELNKVKVKCIRASEGISYLFLFGKKKLLFMGDSVATDEMIYEKPDVVLFPVWAVKGGEANLKKFKELARESRCIPMHYHRNPDALPNFYISSEDFQDLSNMNVNMEILERNKPYQI